MSATKWHTLVAHPRPQGVPLCHSLSSGTPGRHSLGKVAHPSGTPPAGSRFCPTRPDARHPACVAEEEDKRG